MIVHLSSDCKHYTANFFRDSIVCFGDFDRETGNFVRKSEKIISAHPGIERTNIINSIISRDNKKIYYFCQPFNTEKRTIIEILSVDIVDGKPNYENIDLIYSVDYNRAPQPPSDMFYGYDGNIYIIHFGLGKVFKIMSYTNGKTTVEEFLSSQNMYGLRSEDFLADWFSKKQCGENTPCPEIEKPKIICE